ncbi:hypothetical protein [Anaerofustis sp. NSJ-163]|uniref:hypothetical protein n=1 Tax=Anaerofustis sp. NSJ-163 TaxID=2944391 RepID=UPI00209BCE9F|nr:hypothetical protein [Anaerofustis sp. NSJ-163]MCO8192950.1 hypothetical protein [Anaerofustis sp. NSJ-163]
MNNIIPILILIVLITIGFIYNILELKDLNKRYDFTNRYLNNLQIYLNDLFFRENFNNDLYTDLTFNIKEMQYELGYDGIYQYVKDNLYGFTAKNYQLLINFLPETRNCINNSILESRCKDEANDCIDMFIRHLGTLQRKIDSIKKDLFNPFISFAQGVRFIIALPVLILKWFGIISKYEIRSIQKNVFFKIIGNVVTITSFASNIIAIFIGWDKFYTIIKTILNKM